MSATFEEIARAWILEYNDRLPKDRSERLECFIVLLGNLADHGFGKEDLDTQRKTKIVALCVNPNHRDKKKLKNWVSMVVKDLEAALLIYYGTVKIRKNVATDEMKEKMSAIIETDEKSRALNKNQDSEHGESQSSEPEEEFKIEYEEALGQQPLKNEEELKITEEMFDKDEGPNIVWDEEFYKKLGVE